MAFYGQITCQSSLASGKPCTNRAYYLYKDQNRCGTHSKKEERKKLPVDPQLKNKKAEILKQRNFLVEETARKNREQKITGKVICTKLRMMKEPDHHDGYLKIFPNYRHQNRLDGFGCSSLSPMCIGPIRHGQPGLPDSKNLENFHQFNKVFASELDDQGKILPSFYSLQKEMYLSDRPQRHKPQKEGKKVPEFSLWIRPDGTEMRATYLQSRQFYCNFYERSVKELPDFIYLTELLKNGYNLQIVGYDGYSVETSVKKCYLDTSRPFGHELVLYTMLTCEESKYPWRKFKTEKF